MDRNNLPSPPSATQSGVTLIELVIVIVIVGILAVSATYQDSVSSADMTVPSQAERLASDLRYAQSLAVTTGTPYQLLRNSANSYSVCNTAGTPVCDLTVTRQYGIAFGGDSFVKFSTNGTPSSGASFTVSTANLSRTVCVAATTGHISVIVTGSCP